MEKGSNFNLLDKFAFQLETPFMPRLKRRSHTFIFFWLIVLSINWFVACQSEECVSIYNNYLLVGFIKADTLENGKIELSPLDTVFYSVTAEGNDSVFYDQSDVTSFLQLPVNPAGEFTSFKFEMIDSIGYDSLSMQNIYYRNPTPHTISVSYHRGERIIVDDCGIEISYTKLTLVDSTFQNTILMSDKLSRLNELTNQFNIEVLF